jgi:histidyl-tRNA synthetase
MNVQKPRGTQDLFFENAQKFEFIVGIASKMAKKHNYHTVKTPTFEHVELFERNIGEETDAVSKELYRFSDRGDRKLALRPEFTASIARAYTENAELSNYPAPLRMFSHGQLFRYNRAQKGRYREFHQINFESYNETSDISILTLAVEILKHIGILAKTKLIFNYFGSAKDSYTQAVYEYFKENAEKLSQTSGERLEKNPLRILDSKEPQDIALFASVPKIDGFYSSEDIARKNEISSYLQTVKGLNFSVDANLVRGLDYYTGLVFEFLAPIGENNEELAILGGGRYDNLVKQMGGKPTPAIGFAGGIERLFLCLENFEISPQVFILNASQTPIYNLIDTIQTQLGEEKSYQIIDVEISKIGKTLQKLANIKNSFAVVIGTKEIEAKSAIVKDLNQNIEVGRVKI